MDKTWDKDELWLSLYRVSERLRNYYARTRIPDVNQEYLELTLSQLRVIGCIVTHPSMKMKVKDVAHELGITSGGVSQLVDGLEKIGILKRCQEETDRRIVSITLSDEGRAMYERAIDVHKRIFAALMKDIEQEKIEAFHDVLETMYQRVSLLENDELSLD